MKRIILVSLALFALAFSADHATARPSPTFRVYLATEEPDAASAAEELLLLHSETAIMIPLGDGRWIVLHDALTDVILPQVWVVTTFESGSAATEFYNSQSVPFTAKVIARYQGHDKVKWAVAVDSRVPQETATGSLHF